MGSILTQLVKTGASKIIKEKHLMTNKQEKIAAESFADLFAEQIKQDEKKEGKVVKGTIISIENDMMLIDVGYKTEGRISIREFSSKDNKKLPVEGDIIEVYLEKVENRNGEAVLSREKARREESWGTLEKASEDKVKVILGENPVAKIIRDGELHLTADQRKKLMENRRNKIIEYIQQNSVDPKSGSPHPRQRIELAMSEAKVNVDISENIDAQTQKIIKSIMTIIPLSFDKIKLKIYIPAKFAGSTYSALKNRYSSSIKKEEWKNDGGIHIELEIVGGAKSNLYSLINKLTNGEAEIEE